MPHPLFVFDAIAGRGAHALALRLNNGRAKP
jgi:hypothetical protein